MIKTGIYVLICLFILSCFVPYLQAKTDEKVYPTKNKLTEKIFSIKELPLPDYFPEKSLLKKVQQQKVELFLQKYNSPLKSLAKQIIDLAHDHNLPYSLVVAISGVESTFCHHIPANSYNCWGWNNGKYKFSSYENGLEVVSDRLRKRYFDRTLTSPHSIAPVYAPPSITWGNKVAYFMREIENTDPHIANFK